MTKYGVFSGFFDEVNLPLQLEYREVRTRKKSVFENFLRSDFFTSIRPKTIKFRE